MSALHLPAGGSRTDQPLLGRGLPARLTEIGAVVAAWRHRSRYRRELQRLTQSGPHLIEDIGLSRMAAEREIAKPFWRA